MTVVRCPRCGKTLGAIVAGEMVIRHRGREWIGRASSIRCERCGAIWQATEGKDGQEQGQLADRGSPRA